MEDADNNTFGQYLRLLAFSKFEDIRHMSEHTTVSISKETKQSIDKCAMTLLGLDATELSYDVILSHMASEINGEGDN